MDNRQINKICKYVDTDFWDPILDIVAKYINLLDEATPDKFMDVVWNEIVKKFNVMYNDNTGLISLLDDYKKHFEENPNDYDTDSWKDVLSDIMLSWDIKKLDNNSNDHKYSFFYDLFNVLDMPELADDLEF